MNRRKHEKYFRKQKIYGGILVLISVLVTILLKGDITVLLLLLPLGLYIMFTKNAVIYDDYYYELKAKKYKEP